MIKATSDEMVIISNDIRVYKEVSQEPDSVWTSVKTTKVRYVFHNDRRQSKAKVKRRITQKYAFTKALVLIYGHLVFKGLTDAMKHR